jgi:hypothetical protein
MRAKDVVASIAGALFGIFVVSIAVTILQGVVAEAFGIDILDPRSWGLGN